MTDRIPAPGGVDTQRRAQGESEETLKLKTIWNLFTTLLIAAAVVLALLLVGGRLVGLQGYSVLSGSMEPACPTGSMIYVQAADPGELAVGDVITFRLAEGTVVTHRIVEVLPGVDGPSYRTKGDANEVEDPTPVPAENVIGRVVWAVPRLGYLAAWLQTASGRYGVMAGGALLVLMLLLPDLLGVWTKRPEKGEGL